MRRLESGSGGRLEHVDLLVLPEVHLLDLAGPAQVFASARLDLQLRYIGPAKQLVSAQGLSLAELEALPTDIPPQAALLVIGSSRMSHQLQGEQGRQAVAWVAQHALQYACVGAVCSGALLLAQSGLLDGRNCTTHHELLTQLRVAAPAATVKENCLYVEDGPFTTSAGISTGIDLSLRLVARFFDAGVAQQIARDLVVYQRRDGNAQTLSFWLQHRNHVQGHIHAIQDDIMQSPGARWRVEQFAQQACLSERQFRRRFQLATGESIQNYLQLARLELSKQLLAQTVLSIAQVAERCGFADERSLRRLWQSQAAQSPSQYRRSSSAVL